MNLWWFVSESKKRGGDGYCFTGERKEKGGGGVSPEGQRPKSARFTQVAGGEGGNQGVVWPMTFVRGGGLLCGCVEDFMRERVKMRGCLAL
ncbi:hypothetical protein HanPSC8_Chr04g0151891 [Helianthus annuus]|nr:hypothetical protein HanPSC8_Chr04g0151891 [Helianthus annuus]